MSSLLILLLSCSTEPTPYATALVMEDLADGIGGPKAMAIPGDYVLRNDQIHVAIVGPRYSLGPGLYGGGLTDADLNRQGAEWTNGRGNDRFAELFATVNMNVAVVEDAESIEIVADGSDGGAAIVRVTGASTGFITLLDGLWALTGRAKPAIVTDYILEPGQRWVTMRTTATYAAPTAEGEILPGTYDPLPLLDYAIEQGMSFGDFFLQGGDVDVFAPGVGFDEDGAVYELNEQDINTFTDPFQLDFVGGTADGVSYGMAALDGDVFVPLFTSSQTAAFGAGVQGDPSDDWNLPLGAAYTYERIFAIGDGDMGSVYDAILEARGAETGRVSGFVRELGSLDPLSGVDVIVYRASDERPWSQWETDVGYLDTNGDGSFGGTLPPGDWELMVHETGRPIGDRIPVTVTAGGEVQVVLEALQAADVRFTIVDGDGLWVPAKVSIFPADGQGVVRDPVLGDGYIAGDPERVLFAPYGHNETLLPPGDYVAYATRGPEYELGIAEFSVGDSQTVEVPLQVVQSVDSTGWVSADTHVHAQPSHDSGVSPSERIFTMVCEGVEFLVSTDHDYVLDYAPYVEGLGLEWFIKTAVGLEVTTVEVGHYIGWPLVHDTLSPNGGSIDWTGLTPDEIFDEIRDIGDPALGEDPVTFITHPRDGILGYFDQYGFDPYAGVPGEQVVETSLLAITNLLLAGENFTDDYDSLELLNGKRFDFMRTPTQDELDRYAAGEEVTGYEVIQRTAEEQQDLEDGVYTLGYGRHGQIDDWFTLLNLGFRYTAIGNSDTHGKTSTEAGCPRNYFESSVDDPAFIDPYELAVAVKEHRVFTSYGPFLRFWVDDPDQGIGSEISASGEVEFYIEVQSPTWFDVDRVELYENGRLIWEQSIETPNADVLNLATTVPHTPTEDAWYVLIAMGDDDLSPLNTPVEIPYVELQDVVTEALSNVDGVSNLLGDLIPYPRTYPTYPYALTNPIWIDVDGGGWDAPGIPDWLVAPPEPTEAEGDE